jgi:hypothetical protein
VDDGLVTPDDVRALALTLPGTEERPHHERTSFRVGGKIYATMPPDGATLNVLLDEEEARSAASDEGVDLLWWGTRLSGVQVALVTAEPAVVAELLEDAWYRRAPRDLVARRRPTDADH